MSKSPSKRTGRSYHFTLAIKFEHYEVESLEVRLPSLFSLQHRHQIPEVVTLFDHKGNEFDVVVVKRGIDVFFSNGWCQVGMCLGLHDGGWLKMIYVTPGRFYFEARDRLFIAPFCPAPPRIVRLNAEPRFVQPTDGAICPVDPSVYVGRKPTVVMAFYATLRNSDVATPFLHLLTAFCNVVFPLGNCEVTVVDEKGKAWVCGLVFPTSDSQTDVLLRGWNHIVEAQGLEEGYAYKLEVPVETTNLIYFGGH